jgi:hypothetical protein
MSDSDLLKLDAAHSSNPKLMAADQTDQKLVRLENWTVPEPKDSFSWIFFAAFALGVCAAMGVLFVSTSGEYLQDRIENLVLLNESIMQPQ